MRLLCRVSGSESGGREVRISPGTPTNQTLAVIGGASFTLRSEGVAKFVTRAVRARRSATRNSRSSPSASTLFSYAATTFGFFRRFSIVVRLGGGSHASHAGALRGLHANRPAGVLERGRRECHI